MRINLTTPFAEKDAVKALGARWDAAKKLWYITDVTDLTPFERWIPDLKAATGNPAGTSPPRAINSPLTRVQPAKVPITTHATTGPPDCGCKVLPWDDCEHTARS